MYGCLNPHYFEWSPLCRKITTYYLFLNHVFSFFSQFFHEFLNVHWKMLIQHVMVRRKWCLWCYSEFISTSEKLKMLAQCNAVRSVRVCDISKYCTPNSNCPIKISYFYYVIRWFRQVLLKWDMLYISRCHGNACTRKHRLASFREQKWRNVRKVWWTSRRIIKYFEGQGRWKHKYLKN